MIEASGKMGGMGTDQPLISVDVVPVYYDRGTRTMQVWLGDRLFDPFKGAPALPGVLLGHELLDAAAYRALDSKLAASQTDVTCLGDVGVFDNPNRDPRGPTLSIGKFAVLSDRYAPTRRQHQAPMVRKARLPFDHTHIVTAAARVLADQLLGSRDVTRAILGERFSTKDLVAVYRQLRQRGHADRSEVDVANLQRKLRSTGWVVKDGSEPASGEAGRPATMWKFTN